MSPSSSTAVDASPASPVRVESMGGPLLVIPVSALAAWHGSTPSGGIAGDGTAPDDYDRACEVDGLAGAITVDESGTQALVLADEPAISCYLPEHRAFLRRLAADSASGLMAAAEAVFADPAAPWEECGTWMSEMLPAASPDHSATEFQNMSSYAWRRRP
ncbi:Imm21 family immunity protein [Streptomyces sp. NPDC048434]|uniref:Imm21 family immunity protein n=1 Tax=Streptomyces sp. NPDC048434 TaxID=3365549 RepID=UPI003719FF7E